MTFSKTIRNIDGAIRSIELALNAIEQINRFDPMPMQNMPVMPGRAVADELIAIHQYLRAWRSTLEDDPVVKKQDAQENSADHMKDMTENQVSSLLGQF